MKKVLALFAFLSMSTILLTACGSSSSNSAGTASSHNAADVTFAQSMIPHHKQAVEMAKLAKTRAADPKVKDLAARIEAAQDPEIATMTGWLTSWSAAQPGDMTGMTGMPGMMSMADLEALTATTGTTFDKSFLTMMLAHHTGALSMAKTELDGGSDARAKALAQAIIDGQTKEIAEMKGILGAS